MPAKNIQRKAGQVVIASAADLPDHLDSRIENFLITFDAWQEVRDHLLYREGPESLGKKRFRKKGKAGDIVERNLDEVVMAVLDGHWFKISGHARTRMWSSGELDLPADRLLRVKAYQSFSHEDLDRLFISHADPMAHAHSHDRVHEAIRNAGLAIQSKNLRHGYFAGALNYAIRGCQHAAQPSDMIKLDMVKAVEVYHAEIEAIDDLGVKAEYFSTGVLAAALVSVALYPETIEIWSALNENAWIHDSKRTGFDAAGIMHQVISHRRGNAKITRSPVGHHFMFRFCLAVIEEHQAQKRRAKKRTPIFTSFPQPIDDVAGLLERVRETKGYAHERDLFQPPSKLPKSQKFFREDKAFLVPRPTDTLDLKPASLLGLTAKDEFRDEITRACLYALQGKRKATPVSTREYRKLLGQLEREFTQLNKIKPLRYLFTPGILGAALASLRISSENLELWEDLNAGSWTRASNGDLDAPGIIHQMILLNWDDHLNRLRKWDDDAFERSMMVLKTWLEAWEEGVEKTYKNTPRGLKDPIEYIEYAIANGYEWTLG